MVHVLSDIYVLHFPISLCGVGENVENCQSYCAGMVFESYANHSFSFCHLYLDLSHDFHAQICFHSHF